MPINFLFSSVPAFPVTSGIFLGTVIGVSVGKISSLLHEKPGLAKSTPQSLKRNKANVKLPLRKEELDILKKRVQTGTVSVHKEVLTENKTIRIPVKTERIKIVKHPVALEEVSVYKQKLQRNQRITATLKKENIELETKGDPIIKDIRKYRNTGK